MRRYIRSSRTRKNVIETSALRDQFIKQLTAEATALLSQFSEQFSQTLQTQLNAAAQNLVGQSAASGGDGDKPELNSIESIGGLLSTGIRYLIAKPKTSRNTVETSRSVDANASFRLSQSQASIEASAALARGDKNA